MRHISRWSHLAPSTVLLAAQSTSDRYGKPSYGSDVAYCARISRKRVLVRTGEGQEVDSRRQVHIIGSAPILETHRLTLSTADEGSTEAAVITPKILAVERRFDGNGAHHVVLHLG